MFSFDGDFRRRPQQNLGGASQKHGRSELIRKAQHERQKREEIRRRNNNAIIIQSYMKSYLFRKNFKNLQRKLYDEYLNKCYNYEINSLVDLDFLLKRLIYFYNINNLSDCKKLIFVSQYILKNNKIYFLNLINNNIWEYRTKRLIYLCMKQLFKDELSIAIPFRIIEVYTSYAELINYYDNNTVIVNYLNNIYNYLINNNYFNIIRKLIDKKIPPLYVDCDLIDDRANIVVTPPNQQSEIILNLLIRPLDLVNNNLNLNLIKKIIISFTTNILSSNFNEAIKYFIIPALAQHPHLPYIEIINVLGEHYQNCMDYANSILIVLDDDDHDVGGCGGLHGVNRIDRKNNLSGQIFTSFLLYSLFKMDEKFLRASGTSNLQFASNYVKVISAMTGNISKLPKTIYRSLKPDDRSDDIDDDDDSDAEEKDNSINHLSLIERTTLIEILKMMNDAERIQFVLNYTDQFLGDPNSMHCLCRICHDLMTYDRMAVYEYKLLYMLAFKPTFIKTLWFNLTHFGQNEFSSPLSMLSKGLAILNFDQVIPILVTFCALFHRLISTLHDGEFCQEDVLPGATSKIMPFTLDELIPLSTTLKEICLGLVELAFPETRSNLQEHYRLVLNSFSSDNFSGSSSGRGSGSSFYHHQRQHKNHETKINIWPNLLKVCVSLLRQLHTRDLRRGFCPENHWTAQGLNLPLDKPTDLHLQRGRRGPRPFQPIQDFTREDIEDGPPLSIKQIRSITILREIPFVVPFNTRVGVLQGLLAADKLRTQGDLQGFLQGPSISIMVRRTHLYEDAFDKLSSENEPDLRPRFRIQMVNAVGLEEVGIDGGGVFREFLSELIKTAFDPHRGFFMITTDNKLYPNPSVGKIVEDYQRHYYFIGRILGKALYENLLVELPLAEFFLSKLAGKHSDVDIHQLASLDPVLHRNLLSLKAYEGDVSELGLDFTVVCDDLGETRVEELRSNGSNIMVNSSNRIEYIQLMADFKLNKQIRRQCMAFRQGLSNVLPIEWLYMFSNKELQVLISGAEIPVDIEDLKVHTKYGGEFSLEHPTIIFFWRVLEHFNDNQRRQLLKFVTSCSRPPLLGFKDLDPPFCIQNAGDTDRLPSASTCMNLLKLPAFENESMLREKLLYAIQSGAGFELS